MLKKREINGMENKREEKRRRTLFFCRGLSDIV
jgi:hypothetical protein